MFLHSFRGAYCSFCTNNNIHTIKKYHFQLSLQTGLQTKEATRIFIFMVFFYTVKLAYKTKKAKNNPFLSLSTCTSAVSKYTTIQIYLLNINIFFPQGFLQTYTNYFMWKVYCKFLSQEKPLKAIPILFSLRKEAFLVYCLW